MRHKRKELCHVVILVFVWSKVGKRKRERREMEWRGMKISRKAESRR